MGQQATFFEHGGHDVAQPAGGCLLAQHVDFGDKGRNQGAGPAFEGADGIMQRAAQLFGNVLQLLQAARTDTAGRKVDHAHKAGVVVRVGHEAQIGQRMLDLGTLEKAQSAIHPVGDTGVEQRRLDDPALGIAAVQHGNF